MRGVWAMVAWWVLVGALVPGTAWAASRGTSTDGARLALADVVFDGVAHVTGGSPAAEWQDTITFSVRRRRKALEGLGPAILTQSPAVASGLSKPNSSPTVC